MSELVLLQSQMKLLALILAYLISHTIQKPDKLRDFTWFKSWAKWFEKSSGIKSPELNVILTVAIPVTVIYFILSLLFGSVLGVLLVSVLILFYVIGPHSLEEDAESGEIHKRLGLRKNTKVSTLIKTMTEVSMHRWFGVFFWYVVLGVAGALIYRLSERLDFYTENDNELKSTTTRLMKVLNFPAAWMMVISLAIASDFERIFKKCKPYMSFENIKSMDDSFLYEATDFAVEICEIEPDEQKNVELVTLSVLKRMLVVWLVVVSIQVILAI